MAEAGIESVHLGSVGLFLNEKLAPSCGQDWEAITHPFPTKQPLQG